MLAALQQTIGIRAEIGATSLKTEDKDVVGLAAVSGLFVTSKGIANTQNFVSIADLNTQPIILEKTSRVASRTDTLWVSDKTGKASADGHRKLDLPQVRGGWVSYDECVTALDTTRPANLLLQHSLNETHTYIVKIDAEMKSVAVPVSKKVGNTIGIMEVIMKKAEDKIKIFRILRLRK